MRWPWRRWIRRTTVEAATDAGKARVEAERKLWAARQQRGEVHRAAQDLASIIEQSMRRPQ